MPVRKIPKNYRCVTGTFSSSKMGRLIQFESTLERDFLCLCEFDFKVKSIEEQPVTIKFTDAEGMQRSYTPDFLIKFRDGLDGCYETVTWLCEIKYREDAHQNWAVLKDKFKAGNKFASEQGWKFRVLTDKLIRSVYLVNAHFLIQYRTFRDQNKNHTSKILEAIQKQKVSTPTKLLGTLTEDKWELAEMIPALWHLLATGRIRAALYSEKLTMNSEIRTPNQFDTSDFSETNEMGSSES